MSEPRVIDTITTEELITELTKRCCPAVFIGTRNEGVIEGGNTNFFEATGNKATCYGMCHELAFIIQQKMIQESLE